MECSHLFFIFQDTGFVMVQGTTYWTDLFVRHFLFQTDRSTDADDLLFFIRKKQLKGSRYIPKYQVSTICVSCLPVDMYLTSGMLLWDPHSLLY